MFRSKKNRNPEVTEPANISANSDTRVEAQTISEIPRVCVFDLPDDVLEHLSKQGLNCTAATLGALVDIPNKKRADEHLVDLNYSFPRNIHEYDIIVIDMDNHKHVPYAEWSVIKEGIRGDKLYGFVSRFPETLFDPKPFAASALKETIDDLLFKNFLLIVFADEELLVEYKFVDVQASRAETAEREKISNFSFHSALPGRQNKYGKVIQVAPGAQRLTDLLSRHLPGATYNVIFYHPTIWNKDEGKSVKDNMFVPLLINRDDEIVGYAHLGERSAIFMLPQIKDKKAFLSEFLTSQAPEIFPELFPSSKHFAWIEDQQYFLPNHASLLSRRHGIKSEYDAKMAEIDTYISENQATFSFLHDLLTETGSVLVKAVEKFLEWLSFEDVVNVDETSPELREEDLRITIENGLTVVEVKGIGGTSTDSDCSQISKIRHRRCEERGGFDVFGLYIVNHQRFIPPPRRKHPPFTPRQIKDAENDKRGLLTTYQLFRLFFMIEEGVITKQEAKRSMLAYGLVAFSPSDVVSLGVPTELYQDRYVAIIKLSGQQISKGDTIFLHSNGDYRKATVESLMCDDKEIPEARNGEIGVRLDIQIPKKAELFLKISE